MPDQRLDIIVTVQDGGPATAQIKGLATATTEVGTASQEASKQTSGLRRAISAAAIAGGAYKAFQFLKGAVTDTTSLAKATAGLARVTGMDTQTAAGWVEMGKLRNVQSKQLNQGFITFSRQIASAEQGSKSAKTSFEQLGLSQKQLGGLSTQQAIGRVADAFQKLPAGADKAALAQRLFGRQSQALLPLLNEGGKALGAQTAEMGKNSGMTKQSVKDSLALAAQQRKLAEAMDGIKIAVGTALIPVLTALSQIITPIAQAFAHLMQTSPAVRTGVMLITGAITMLVPVLLAANAGFIALNAEWIWIPALIGAVIVGIMLLWTKCAWFRDAVTAVWDAVKAGFNLLLDAIKFAWNWIKGNWPILVGVLFGPFGIAVGLIVTHWSKVKQIVGDVIQWLKARMGDIAGVITGVLTGAWRTLHGVIQSVIDAIHTVRDAIHAVVSLPGKAGHLISSAFGSVTSGLGSIIPHQHGGVIAPGGTMALVGEAGPEIVALPGGTRVIPNHQIGGLGGGRTPIITQVFLDSRQIATALGEYVAGEQARR